MADHCTGRSTLRLSMGASATALTIVGSTDLWMRVEPPDGFTDYVVSNTTESAKHPLRIVRLSAPAKLLDGADPLAAAKKDLRVSRYWLHQVCWNGCAMQMEKLAG